MNSAFPRTIHRGCTFVYLLPCRDADVAKIGYSRDPLGRLRTLHPRFFDLFDLGRGLLLETERLSEARAIERSLHRRFAEQRVAAPLRVRDAAAGRFEWFGGASASAEQLLREQSVSHGWPLHAPLRDALRQQLAPSCDRLYDASARLLQIAKQQDAAAVAYATPNHASATLSQMLDTFEALGFALERIVPDDVLHWQQQRHALRFDR